MAEDREESEVLPAEVSTNNGTEGVAEGSESEAGQQDSQPEGVVAGGASDEDNEVIGEDIE